MVKKTLLKEYTTPHNSFIGGWYISPEICDDLINYFEANKKYCTKGHCGTEGGKSIVDPNRKLSFDLTISYQNFDVSIGIYREQLQEVLDNYLKKYSWANRVASFNINENFNIQKYPKEGGFKEWHFENSGQAYLINRHLVFMTYLNDVEDGGTEFFYQDITTSAKKGLTLIWPAGWTHLHRGQVSKKEKYIITGWYGFEEERNIND